jgi:hypothetical protein
LDLHILAVGLALRGSANFWIHSTLTDMTAGSKRIGVRIGKVGLGQAGNFVGNQWRNLFNYRALCRLLEKETFFGFSFQIIRSLLQLAAELSNRFRFHALEIAWV